MSFQMTMEGVGKERGGRRALRDVTLSLEAGDRLAVFGPNGAGKTTLLRLMALLDRPGTGRVSYREDGRALDARQARARIGLVTHAPQLYPDLTGQENLVLFGRLHGVPRPRERARELLDAVGLRMRRDEPVRGYSRGMLQRLAFARALVGCPDVLLLDEAFAGLDRGAASTVRALAAQDAPGRIVVEAGHDFGEAYAAATQVLLLDRGRVADLFAGPVPRRPGRGGAVCGTVVPTAEEAHARYRALFDGRTA